MKDKIIAYLGQLYPIAEGLRVWLKKTLKERRLARKELLLKAGERGDFICFIVNGLLRSYTLAEDGSDTTVWFMKEMDIAISVKSFYEQAPGREYIEALESSLLFYITYAELEEAYRLFPDFNILGRRLTERYYVLSEERLHCIRNKKAEDRYRFLQEHHPDIVERVPDKYISSYLDISTGTLCRLKHSIP